LFNDNTGNTAVLSADKDLKIRVNKKYKEGISICRKLGCTRICGGKCYGWQDPLFMWEHYGECPYFSDDKDLVKKIDESCKNYQDYMDGRGDLVGEKAEVSH